MVFARTLRPPARTSRPLRLLPLPALGGAAWLLLAGAVVGLQPLAAGEAEIVAGVASGSELWQASPLGAMMLWLVGALGPPMEWVHRLAGLCGVAAAALAAFELCARLAGSRRAGTLAALCIVLHGPTTVGATLLSPTALLLGAEGLLVLSALRCSRQRTTFWRAAVAATAALVVAVEPLGLLLVGAVAGWLGSVEDERPGAVSGAVAALALLAGAAWGGALALPAVPTPSGAAAAFQSMARQLLGVGVGQGMVTPSHPVVVIAAPVTTALVGGLAAAGAVRTAPGPRILGLGLAAAALAIGFFRGADGAYGGVGYLLFPPMALLASLRLVAVEPGADASALKAILVGLALLTGIEVAAEHRHEESRAVAAALEPGEVPLSDDQGLLRAIAFYRRADGAAGGTKARIFRRGERQPRLVAAHAFGRRMGRLWIVRPGRPVYDLGASLEDAVVQYVEAGVTYPCPWQDDLRRFFCGGPEYQHVVRSSSTFDGRAAEAVYAHPLDDGVLEIRWSDIPLGSRLVGLAGLDDPSIDFSTAEVDLEVRAGRGEPLRLKRGRERGLLPFFVETGAEARGDVVLRLSADDDRGRHLFFDALVVE